MADWLQLSNDLLSIIGMFCSLPPFPKPPYLILSEPQLLKSEESAHQKRFTGSKGNWLITVDKSRMIQLLNPFSRVQIDLPSQYAFDYYFDEDYFEGHPESKQRIDISRDCFLKKVILSSTPSEFSTGSKRSSSKDCIAMACHYYHKGMAIARPGDASWTTVETPIKDYVDDAIFLKGQFYCITGTGILMVCDVRDGLPTPKATELAEKFLTTLNNYQEKYLVEWNGELLLVFKIFLNLLFPNHNDGEEEEEEEEVEEDTKLQEYKTEKFEVFKFDFTNKKWEEVNSLGEYCLFLGFNTSVSILACDYPGCLQENCIYFTDDITFGCRDRRSPVGFDMGVFNLEDKSIQPHYKGISTCYYSPPLWMIPTPF
ncbi:hypothetical protein AQUCO_00700260v1 [Aquilegia coerulea]|uniref:KIB1-4 beta-propeller domain-containing protein n=1 Tax=Aquilegia coerulea TaxID=218851 RepID=A0A2G5EJ91_AQUCA|nr:hypothetical protein AQUCO_00700260v1 [Aquilegia coerulea]